MAAAGAVVTVAIANGESQSAAFALAGKRAAGVIMPAAWTAAALTFLVSDAEDGTFVPLYDASNAEVTIASAGVVASRAVSFDTIEAKLAPWAYMKLRSGTAGAPVNQGAARSIIVCMK